MTTLDTRLEAVRSKRKALVPYFVAGLDDTWLDCVRAAAFAGADAIEIGIPFSDPIMDGAIIQDAALQSLNRGTTLTGVLDQLSTLEVDVPLIAMTYFNIFHHHGLERSASDLASAGVQGVIVPDVPLEELPEWQAIANHHDVATVLMVAPSTPTARVEKICTHTQGFVYAAARMAVTGVTEDSGRGSEVVAAIREFATTPVYVGIGISTPEQARVASEYGDGVIVGSALVQKLLNGEGTHGVETFIASLREAIDSPR